MAVSDFSFYTTLEIHSQTGAGNEYEIVRERVWELFCDSAWGTVAVNSNSADTMGTKHWWSLACID